MSFRSIPLDVLQKSVDFFFARWPRPIPDQSAWQRCRIISHRGEFNNSDVFENTIPAFENALKAGIWGIELDIRWTKDLYPVVTHDDNGYRLFHKKIRIRDCNFKELRSKIPDIPSLEEVIHNFGEKLHLMIEIKKEPYPDRVKQNDILERLLHHLEPVRDYHFLALNPKLFRLITFVPKKAFLTVSELNNKALSSHVLKEKYGGITGHYLLITKEMIRRHKMLGQSVGTGFIASEKGLFRELNRGVDWIFSNRAAALQKISDRYRHKSIQPERKIEDSNIRI